jgi:hypothetical protein
LFRTTTSKTSSAPRLRRCPADTMAMLGGGDAPWGGSGLGTFTSGTAVAVGSSGNGEAGVQPENEEAEEEWKRSALLWDRRFSGGGRSNEGPARVGKMGKWSATNERRSAVGLLHKPVSTHAEYGCVDGIMMMHACACTISASVRHVNRRSFSTVACLM